MTTNSDLPAGNDKRLNNMVAVTVVAFSVLLGLCNIKDGNIVQAMSVAKADSVDTWGDYQATRTKLAAHRRGGGSAARGAGAAGDRPCGGRSGADEA